MFAKSGNAVFIDARNHLTRLPAQAADWFVRLDHERADARSNGSRLELELHELHQQQIEADARERILTRPRVMGGGGLSSDDPRIKEIEQELAAINARRKKINEHNLRTEPRARALAGALGKCEQFVKGHRGEFRAVVANLPPPKRGQNLPDMIDLRQHRLRELEADQHRINSAPLPAALAKVRVRDQIGTIAERGRVGIEAIVEHDGEIDWPTTARHAPVYVAGSDAPGLAQWAEADTLAMMVWLNRDAVIKRLNAEIDAIADDAHALTPEQRAEQLEQIAANRLAIEREEAALIWQAIDGGSNVTFRADADPRAVLGIEAVSGDAW